MMNDDLSKMTGASPFIETLADRISGDLKKARELYAPSQLDLSERYAVSRSSIRRALKVLEKRGILFRRQGRRTIITANQRIQPKVPSRKRALEQVTQYLREQVVSGKIRSKEAFPKIEALSRQLGTSSVTICRALTELSNEELIHKAGKSWIAGPSPSEATEDLYSVFIVLQQKPHSWLNMNNSRTGGFVSAFTHEAQIHKTIVQSVVADERFSYFGWFPAGRGAIERLRETYGTRLRGTLIAGSTKEIADLDNWIGYLVERVDRVVWFDRYGEQKKTVERRNLVLCRLNERPALRIALDYLKSRNHSEVVYLDFFNESWSVERGRLLAGQAAKMGIRLHRVDNENALSPDEAKNYFRDTVARARGTMAPEPDYEVNRIRIAITGLRLGATAILAANDDVARRVYSLFMNRGIRIPDRISLLSFDNSQMVFPFDSVDFGFDNLGYSAFHSLLGDIPMRSRNRLIETRPWIAQRASTSIIRKS
jgi:DNA-binding transcriptional regulator YhcF (GntR family)